MSGSGLDARLERLFELSSELLAVVGFDGRFRRLNPAWTRRLGLGVDELLARPLLEWIHPEDRNRVLDHTRRLQDAGGDLSFDARFRAADGSWRRLSWSASLLPGRAEFCAAARDSSPPPGQTFRLRLAAPPDGIVILGRGQRIAIVAEETPRVRRAATPDGGEPMVEVALPEAVRPEGAGFEILLGPPGAAASDAPAPAAAAESDPIPAAILRGADDAILVRNREGVVTAWSPGAQRLYGHADEEVLGRPSTMLVPPEYATEERRVLDRTLQGETLPAYETERVRRGGGRVDVSISVFPLRDAAGSVCGAAEIARDVTAKRLAEKELARRAEELAASNADLQDYAFVIAHDLQEPLHMIEGHLQELARAAKGRLGEEGEAMAAFALDGAAWMKRLIRGLLDYARLSTRGRAPEPVDAGEVADRVIANLAASIREAGATVTRGPLPVVAADPVQLAEVFQNLAGNALKFRGAAPPEVRIEAERRGAEWRFSVRDNGIGIDPNGARRLFRPLQRLHDESEFPGTGLGLAITRKIVERHGGRIWVDSTPGKGSIFYFTIPAADEGRVKGPESDAGGGAERR